MGERVLIYADVNPNDRGGVQAVCSRLAASLRRAGHHVATAWRDQRRSSAGDAGLPLPPLVWRNGRPAPRSLVESSRALVRLAWTLARVRPAVVNVHFVTSAAGYFLLLKPIFRYRLVLSVHGSDALRPEPEHAMRLAELLRRADAITVVSSTVAEQLASRYGMERERLHVIFNGVDEEFWGAGAEARRARTVISVGRLDPVKGHDVLVRAFAQLLGLVPDARLVIAGDGGFRPALVRLAADLGVEPFVEFTGELDPAGVRDRLADAGVFVLPSRSEGLPLALIEAMAAGLPVVATAVGGVPEVLTPGTGLLVQPEDPARLATTLAHVLLDGEAAAELGRQARVRARAFSARGADAEYETILVRAARGRKQESRGLDRTGVQESRR